MKKIVNIYIKINNIKNNITFYINDITHFKKDLY